MNSRASALGLAIGSACLFSLAAVSAAEAETRGYVISSFTTATHSVNFAEACPENRNGGGADWRIRDMIMVGVSPAKARQIAEGEGADPEIRKKLDSRAIVKGKPVPVLNYPDAAKDPNIETISGKYAYGFDLGSPNQAAKFIDPETGEKVDNQLWRAIGCTASYRAVPPVIPFPEEVAWEAMVQTSPGWAVMITGDDLSKDGKITVTLDRLTKNVERDATGNVMSGATYVIDPTGKSRNVLQGELKNGVIHIKQQDIFLESELPFYPEIDLRNGHIRMKLEPDGTLSSIWGGFMKWKGFAYMITSRPGHGGDALGIYHAVKKMADARPDKNGQNQDISSAWRVKAVPAYLATRDGKIVAQAVLPPVGQQLVASNASARPAN